MMDKEKYLKNAFKAYRANKKRLREMSFDGMKKTNYGATSRPTGTPKGYEQALVSYLDEKAAIEKQVEIVERTLEYYEVRERAFCDGKAKYIRCRYLKGYNTIRTTIECNISEGTFCNWCRDIMDTAAAVADMYTLWA